MKWRVYYSDSTFEGPIEEAPERDVLIIIQEHPRVGWAMIHSADYFIWDNTFWRGTDIFGLWDYLATPGWKRVLFGRQVPDTEWQEVYQRAKADREFGKKEGYLPGERRKTVKDFLFR